MANQLNAPDWESLSDTPVVPDWDSLSDKQPLAEKLGEAGKARPSGYMFTGPGGTTYPFGAPSEQQIATAVRYGGPVAAGLAITPMTAGMGTVPAMLTASATGAGSSSLFEKAAQMIEGTDDPTAVKAAAAYGAAPYLSKGNLLARSMFNVPSFISSVEAGKLVEAGGDIKEYKEGGPKSIADATARWGVPTLFALGGSYLGARGERLKTAAVNQEFIKRERFGGGGMLSELIEGTEGMEAAAFARGNKNAQRAFESMGKNIGDAIAESFPTQSLADVAEELRPMVGKLDTLGKNATAAAENARALAAQAEAARTANSIEFPKIMAKAKVAALEAVQAKSAKQLGSQMFFGGVDPSESAESMGRLMLDLKETSSAAKDVAKLAIDDLYAKAGFDLNTPVVSWSDVLESVRKNSGPGKLLHGDDARAAFLKEAKKAFTGSASDDLVELDKLLGGNPESITLERFRNVKAGIAEELVRKGKDPAAANRIAAEQYSVMKDASDNFINRAYPDKAAAFKAADAAAAQHFSAKGTNAIDMISKGDIAGVVGRIKKEGWKGPIATELLGYKDTIANTFDAAKPGAREAAAAAADKFMMDINAGIKSALIDDVIDRSTGLTSGFRSTDIEKLAGELQTLSSRGFPVESLGMGNASGIRKLAQVASAGKASGLGVEDLNTFFSLVGELGADKAVARMEFRDAVKKFVIEQGVGIKANKQAEMFRAAKRAGVDSNIAAKELELASKDPLVKLLNQTDLGLGSDPKANAGIADRLLNLEAPLAREFVQKLKDTGRGEQAEKVSKAVAAKVFRQFESAAESGDSAANLEKIYDFFNSKGAAAERARETFMELLGGRNKYESLKSRVVDPVMRIVAQQRSMYGGQNVRLPNGLMYRPTQTGSSVFARIPFGTIVDLVKDARYNLLYTIYVNPNVAPKIARYGGDLALASSSDPVIRNALTIANMDDVRAKQEPPREEAR